MSGAAAALALAAPASASNQALADAAGKLLVAGFSGASADDPGVRAIGRDIAAGRVGGVILFARNVRSRPALARLVAYLKGQAPGGDLLLFVDQEGGRVARLNGANGWRNWPSAARVSKKALGRASRIYADMAFELARAGVDVNIGPVVDLGRNPANSVIFRAGRSFGANPAAVAAYAKEFVLTHRRVRVRTCLKHYPGHGASTGDTHDGAVSMAGLWRPSLDLAPFKKLISGSKAGCVMTSHLYVPRLSGPGRPIVTFSKRAIDHLRGALGFRGVVITDDLMMGAVRARARFDDAVVKALAAGHDLALTGRPVIRGKRAAVRFRAAVLRGLKDGRLSPDLIRAALARRAAWRP